MPRATSRKVLPDRVESSGPQGQVQFSSIHGLALKHIRRGAPAIYMFLLWGQGGCVSASLATNTGPRPPDRAWSMASTQQVHVGEEVRFDFVLTDWLGRFVHARGLADYCVAHVSDERIETNFDLDGHFQFTHRFDRAAPGERITVDAVAFQQRGNRDFVKVRNQWIKIEHPFDEADRVLANDRIIMEVYEAPIVLTLARPPDDFVAETGVMKILRADGKIRSVYIDRPGRRGFIMTASQPPGRSQITCNPDGDDLNPTGTTDVEFQIYDSAGQPHMVSLVLETP